MATKTASTEDPIGQLARAAAEAAVAVPGVRELMPGLAATVVAVARELLDRSAARLHGVDVRRTDDAVQVRLHVAVDGSRTAARIAQDVQHAVGERLRELPAAGGLACEVDVSIVDVTVRSARKEIDRRA